MKRLLKRSMLVLNSTMIICVLSACVPESYDFGVQSIPESKKLTTDNFPDAAAVSMLAFRRSYVDQNNVVTPSFQYILDQKTSGTYPCAIEGNISLERKDTNYIVTPMNCNVEGFQLISGSYTITLNLESGFEYNFINLNYRAQGDVTAQTLTGKIKTSISAGASSTTGAFTVERNKRIDNYSNYNLTAGATTNSTVKISMDINTPRFAHSLNAKFEVSDAGMLGTVIADDGSSVTTNVATDGSIKLDLRSQLNGAIIKSMTMTSAEFSSLMKKISE